jgi:hypothetical protein
MDRKFIPCALLTLGRDPIEGLFFTKDLKIQFGPPADFVPAHKWWCLSDWHHTNDRDSESMDSVDGKHDFITIPNDRDSESMDYKYS